MGTRLTRALAVFGAVALLVIGANAAAFAATGNSFILGKTNKANKVTTVQRTTSGPALNIKTKKSSSAPFTTNAKGKVKNLNADKLDGLDSTALLAKSSAALAAGNDVKAIRFKDPTSTRADDTAYDLGTVAKGTYAVSFSAAVSVPTAGTTATPASMSCYIYNDTPLLFDPIIASGTSVNVGVGYLTPTFSTVLTLAGNENLTLYCYTSASAGYNTGLFSSGVMPELSFVRIDGSSNRTLAP